MGYQKVTKDELSESEEEVFVKEEGGKKEGGARASEKGQPMFRMEKVCVSGTVPDMPCHTLRMTLMHLS